MTTLRKAFGRLLDERFAPSKVQIPGLPEVEASVRLLSDAQAMDARIEAHKHVETLCKDAGIAVAAFDGTNPEAVDRERQVQVIFLAFVDPETEADDDDPKSAFASVGSVRALDEVTIDQLYETYLAFQTSKVVSVEIAGDSIDEALVELREPGSEGVLAALEAPALRALIVAIARRE